MRKKLIFLGTIVSVTPIIAVVSCSKDKTINTSLDNIKGANYFASLSKGIETLWATGSGKAVRDGSPSDQYMWTSGSSSLYMKALTSKMDGVSLIGSVEPTKLGGGIIATNSYVKFTHDLIKAIAVTHKGHGKTITINICGKDYVGDMNALNKDANDLLKKYKDKTNQTTAFLQEIKTKIISNFVNDKETLDTAIENLTFQGKYVMEHSFDKDFDDHMSSLLQK